LVKNSLPTENVRPRDMIDDFKNKIKLELSPYSVIDRKHNELPDSDELDDEFYIKLKKPTSDQYPYLDTFRFIRIENENIIVSNATYEMDYISNSTGGDIDSFSTGNVPILL